MATIYNKEITNAKQVRYHVKLDDEKSTFFTFKEEVDEATLDNMVTEELAFLKAEADKQAIIQKAVDQAFLTDQEKEHLGNG